VKRLCRSVRETDTISTGEAPKAGLVIERLKPERDDAEVPRSPPAMESACLGFDDNSGESDLVPRPLQGAFLIPPVPPVVLIGSS
jgi:hypothetical protein